MKRWLEYLERLWMAVSFAEAGEPETARQILESGRPEGRRGTPSRDLPGRHGVAAPVGHG
jgi:hypothetical protein